MAKVTVADIIGDRIRKAVAGALSDVEGELDKISVDGGNAAAHGIVGDIGALSKLISDFALVALVLDPPVGLGMEALKAAEHEAGKFGIGTGLGYMMGYTAFTMLNPLFMPVQHAIAHTFQNEIHTPQDAAALVARGLMTPAHGSQEAKGSALDQDHFDRLVSLATQRPDVATALELLRRGERDEAFTLGELEHLGYDANTARHLTTLARNLVSPADLALAFLRTDIDRKEMLSYAKRLGVDEADMDLLVGNTGEPPGPEQLLFLYRRGMIDKARLERGIRQSRIRNEWIDAVEALRFVPMSTEEAVRAVVEHHLTDTEGQAIAAQNGLMHEHWRPLVESWGRPLAHMEMGELVHRGLASRSQFDQAMRESDIKNKYVGLAWDITNKLLSPFEILRAIKYNAVTLKAGAKMLMQQGYTPESVSIILKTGLHESAASAHELTRSQITTLYQDGILSRANAEKHLETLGYNHQDAAFMIQIVDVQQHAKEVRAEVSATRASYLAGGIDRAKAEQELRQVGVTAAEAAHSIELWDRERHRAARTLTESQIVKAAKEGVMAFDEAITLLVALGYTRANASVLLLSNGATPAK